MARKTTSRLELRKQAEAAEGREGAEPKKKAAAKKAAAPRAKRTKEKVIARKKLVWVVFNGSMKEEGRFPYDQRAAAEEKIEQLKLKSAKKLYFIQPVKELLGDGKAAPALAAAAAIAEEKAAPRKKPAKVEVAEDAEEEVEEEDEDEDEDEE
ncbi:MAG: hypothetical protein U0872_07275 [Planctomycetaceae bacterium]